MKCTEIHSKFEDKRVRDLLSVNLTNALLNVHTLQEQIRVLQQQLDKALDAEAAKKMMCKLGWQEFDVSDLVEDYNREEYLNFIGTQEEYDTLFKRKTE